MRYDESFQAEYLRRKESMSGVDGERAHKMASDLSTFLNSSASRFSMSASSRRPVASICDRLMDHLAGGPDPTTVRKLAQQGLKAPFGTWEEKKQALEDLLRKVSGLYGPMDEAMASPAVATALAAMQGSGPQGGDGDVVGAGAPSGGGQVALSGGGAVDGPESGQEVGGLMSDQSLASTLGDGDLPSTFVLSPNGVLSDPAMARQLQAWDRGKIGRAGSRSRPGRSKTSLVVSAERGRYTKAELPKSVKKIRKVAVDATLRAAAPHQAARRAHYAALQSKLLTANAVAAARPLPAPPVAIAAHDTGAAACDGAAAPPSRSATDGIVAAFGATVVPPTATIGAAATHTELCSEPSMCSEPITTSTYHHQDCECASAPSREEGKTGLHMHANVSALARTGLAAEQSSSHSDELSSPSSSHSSVPSSGQSPRQSSSQSSSPLPSRSPCQTSSHADASAATPVRGSEEEGAFENGSTVAASLNPQGGTLPSLSQEARPRSIPPQIEAQGSAQGPPLSPRPRVLVRMEDVRVKRMVRRASNLVVFVVDTSGSMYKTMRSVQESIVGLLEAVYVKRDKVAIVLFHKTEAKVLLRPTRSMDEARKYVDLLSQADGATPLAHGLLLALELGDAARRSREVERVLLVAISDGEANIGLPARDAARLGVSAAYSCDAQALEVARCIQAAPNMSLLVLDPCESHSDGYPLSRRIAKAAGGQYCPMKGDMTADGIKRKVFESMRQLTARGR